MLREVEDRSLEEPEVEPDVLEPEPADVPVLAPDVLFVDPEPPVEEPLVPDDPDVLDWAATATGKAAASATAIRERIF